MKQNIKLTNKLSKKQINKREKAGLDHFNDPKAFIEYSNNDVSTNLEEYHPCQISKVSIVFHDMIDDMI